MMRRSRKRVGTGRSDSPWGDQSEGKRDFPSENGMLGKAEWYGSRVRAGRKAGHLDDGHGESPGYGGHGSVGIARIPQPPSLA